MRVGTKSGDIKFRNRETEAGELRGVFGRPRGMVFAKLDFEVAFGGQNIHGQTSMPQRDAKPKLCLAFQADFAAMDGDFKYSIKGSFGDALGIEKAKSPLFYRKFLQVAAHELHYDVDFFGRADRDPEFAIFKFS